MKENDILRKTLLNYINLEYYANSIDEEFETLLQKLENRCASAIASKISLNTKTDYTVLLKIIKEEVNKFREELEERLNAEAEFIMNQELNFLDETYNKSGGINGTLLTLGGIAVSRLLFAPIAGNDTVHQFVEKTGKNIINTYDTSLRSGYLFGQSADDVNKQISNKLPQVVQGMKSGIRTAIPSFAKTTDRIVFLNNNIEVIWITTLDGKTCLTCASLSGMHFRSITEAPSTPHWQCRCQLIAADKVSEPVPDFEEFVESLTEDEQRHVLGSERYNLWKQYGVSLNKFNNNGTVIPKEQIKVGSKVERQVQNDNTAKLVKKYYSKDTFVQRKITDTGSLYVSKERIKAGTKDPTVYNSDKLMAEALIKEKGLDLYLLTENGGVIGTKHPDSFYISETIEMKHVRGGIDKVGKNAIKALEQSENVYLYCDQSFTKERCIRKIEGSVNAKRNEMLQKGKVFKEPEKDKLLIIYTDGKFYELNWGDVL